MLSHWKYTVFFGILLLTANLMGQSYEDEYPYPFPTPTPIPWGSDGGVPPSDLAPMPKTGANPYGSQGLPSTGSIYDEPAFVPIPPLGDGGIDYDDPIYDGGSATFNPGGGSSFGGSGRRSGKSSFVILEDPKRGDCGSWGSEVLSKSDYDSKSECELELNRKLDQAFSAIDISQERLEMYKLKKVIQGEIENREKAKEYKVEFNALASRLNDAADKGCSCSP